MPINDGVTVREVIQSPDSGGSGQAAENTISYVEGERCEERWILFILPVAAPTPRESLNWMPITNPRLRNAYASPGAAEGSSRRIQRLPDRPGTRLRLGRSGVRDLYARQRLRGEAAAEPLGSVPPGRNEREHRWRIRGRAPSRDRDMGGTKTRFGAIPARTPCPPARPHLGTLVRRPQGSECAMILGIGPSERALRGHWPGTEPERFTVRPERAGTGRVMVASPVGGQWRG
jgi:hypothetical protein